MDKVIPCFCCNNIGKTREDIGSPRTKEQRRRRVTNAHAYRDHERVSSRNHGMDRC
jgi:hypothetical protein